MGGNCGNVLVYFKVQGLANLKATLSAEKNSVVQFNKCDIYTRSLRIHFVLNKQTAQ